MISRGAPFGNPATSPGRPVGFASPPRGGFAFSWTSSTIYMRHGRAKSTSGSERITKGAFIGLSYLSSRFGALHERTWRLLSLHTGLYLSAGCPSPSGRDASPAPSACPYSPECIEGAFPELHLEGVLRSSHPRSRITPFQTGQNRPHYPPRVGVAATGICTVDRYAGSWDLSVSEP